MERDWIIGLIEDIAQFGKDGDGITRLAFSEADIKARKYIKEKLREIGLEVRSDQFGNVIGRKEGLDKFAPAVATGSHLDTVPNGGKYDGVVGVVGALAALKRLQNHKLKHPLEIIVFAAEESSRFAYATMGSKLVAGNANLRAWEKIKDCTGITLVEALSNTGLDFNCLEKCVRNRDEIKSFIELHIEQGKTLETTGKKVGIVDIIAAPTRLKITVEGMAGHSGVVSMSERKDALVSAAMVILAIQEIALEHAHHQTVATVGNIKVYPGSINVIPGVAELWVDIRGIDHQSIIECLQNIKDAVSSIAEEQETSISIDILSSDKPVKMDSGIIDMLERICTKKSIEYCRLHSRAGHDAMNMAHLTPTGMIFIPCKNGVSHSPQEYVDIDDIIMGIDVLTEALFELAK